MKALVYNCKTKKQEYRDLTPEEIAEMEKMAELESNQPPTDTERLEALELAMLELAEVYANG